MNVPNTPANIGRSVENIVADLHSSEFADANVDLNIDIMGVLNYTSGMKLRLTFVDCLTDEDMEEWRAIAIKNGASGIKTKVNTGSGLIDINIEYKGVSSGSINSKWLLRAVLLLVGSWSYQQLNLLNPERYPSPIG